MKATSLLKEQHRKVDKLFSAIDKSDDGADKAQLFEELAQNLVAHDAIEREIFYPACESQMGMTALLGEALVEHGVVEFCLYEANNALADDSFDFKMTVLREVVEHHVDEEENELFPAVDRVISKDELEHLGEAMEARFEKARSEDFRGPLFKNLQQVLAGTLKPKKIPTKKNGPTKSEKTATR